MLLKLHTEMKFLKSEQTTRMKMKQTSSLKLVMMMTTWTTWTKWTK